MIKIPCAEYSTGELCNKESTYKIHGLSITYPVCDECAEFYNSGIKKVLTSADYESYESDKSF